MKIVVTGTRGIPLIQGGVETHCENLFPRIAAMGNDVTIIRRSCYVTSENSVKDYKGVRLKDIFAPRKKSFEAIVHTFLAVIAARRMKADILHVHAIGPSFVVPFARLLGLRVVMTHHGPDYDRQKWGKLAKAMLHAGERNGVKYSNEVIVISNVIREIVRSKYHRDSNLIFNGVDRPEKSKNIDYIEHLGLEKGKYVLALGRFVKEKCFDQLIDAFQKSRHDGYKLVIAGDADHPDRLNQIMTNAALFVLPSTHEGLPISLLEAMSYDLDVLVSDIPANKLPELEEKDFFRCRDIQSLADSLSAKLSENRVGRTYDLSNYDWDNIAVQTMSVYQKVVSSK